MGFIRIDISTDEDKKLSLEIESEGIYRISCLTKVPIETLDKIWQICILEDIIVIKTEDRDFRNGCQSAPFIKDERVENNIMAYDWKGNFLWNIGEIVGDIKMSFSNVRRISKKEAEDYYGVTIPQESNVLIECIALGFAFIIDVTHRKMLYKISGKVK